MSAVRTSTLSATPSSSALRSVFCCELSVWSARQMSTPMARPLGSSLAAAYNLRRARSRGRAASRRHAAVLQNSRHTSNLPTGWCE